MIDPSALPITAPDLQTALPAPDSTGIAGALVFSESPIFEEDIRIQKDNLGATDEAALLIDNATPASAITPSQHSGSIDLRGSALDTTTMAPVDVYWRTTLEGFSGTTASIRGDLVFQSKIGASSSWTRVYRLSSNGFCTALGDAVNSGCFLAVSTSSGIETTLTPGLRLDTFAPASALVPSQHSLSTQYRSSGWASVTATSRSAFMWNELRAVPGATVLGSKFVFIAGEGTSVGDVLTWTTPSLPASGGYMWFGNAAAVPPIPSAGYHVYAAAGSFRGIGSAGTITTMGAAEPHCPTCGSDFSEERENPLFDEYLGICLPCMLEEMSANGINISKFSMTSRAT